MWTIDQYRDESGDIQYTTTEVFEDASSWGGDGGASGGGVGWQLLIMRSFLNILKYIFRVLGSTPSPSPYFHHSYRLM